MPWVVTGLRDQERGEMIVGPFKTKEAANEAALVYLEVWQREITSLERPELSEVATNGPDLGVRVVELHGPQAIDFVNHRIRQSLMLRARGTVRFEGGHPASGVFITAFDHDLRSEEPLGVTKTDRNGAYAIAYPIENVTNQERGTADLVVKASDAEGALLVASPVVFNAPADAEINLTIPLGWQEPPSLFEQLMWRLRSIVAAIRSALHRLADALRARRQSPAP